MRYCPSCRSEYEDSVSKCAECGGELLAGPLPADDPTAGWRLLRTVSTDEEARLLAGFLEAEGIETTVEPVNATQLPETLGDLAELRVFVPAGRIDEAETLLDGREAAYLKARSDDDALMTDDGVAHLDQGTETAE